MKMQIDLKSLCAGVLLGAAVVMAMGATSGTQKHDVTLTIGGLVTEYSHESYSNPISIDMR